MGLFRKGKTCIIAKFLWTDLVICSHSREGETMSYNRINTVSKFYFYVKLCKNFNSYVFLSRIIAGKLADPDQTVPREKFYFGLAVQSKI